MSVTILIVGGYGLFGGRLVELIDQDERLTLIIAGRSYDRARDFCYGRLRSRAKLRYARFDRMGDVEAALDDLRPDLVVDCSGPFQAYGKSPYRLIEAAIARGIHYLDLADSAAFVMEVSRFDDAAKAKNVFALSGASTAPALTAAAVRALAKDFAHIDTIHAGIAPSPHARLGESVMRAIASYAGKSVKLRRNGEDATAYPLTEHRRVTIAPPGHVPLAQRLFSLVETPDLRVLPTLWPELRDVWMGAAPVPEILHRMLIALAWCVRIDALPGLTPLAPVMLWVSNHLRWGDHRGGMYVAIEGRDASGAARKRSWHLLAEGDDGALIPSMAGASIVRKLLRGKRPASGARAAARDFELADYADVIGERAIYMGMRDDTPPPQRGRLGGGRAPAPAASSATPSTRAAHAASPLQGEEGLYQRLLGSAWNELPEPIRALHLAASASGRAKVTRGNWLAGLAADLIGFPKASEDIAITTRFDKHDGWETWTRTFGAHSFSSVQSEGADQNQYLLLEHFGPLAVAMALVVESGKLRIVLRRWSVFGVSFPLWLGPRSDAYESVEDGRFRFHVDIRHPLIGRIIKYEGCLEMDALKLEDKDQLTTTRAGTRQR